MSDQELTWHDVAVHLPEFAQWVVQRHGGLPDGPVAKEDYERFSVEYQEEVNRR